MKIHANFNVFAGVHFDAAKYISSPSFGVDRFMLDRIGSEKARATTIVKYQPNSKFPTHIHIGGEEFLVLEGTFKDQFGEFKTGTYVRNPIDSEHAPWVDDDGCTILVKLLQMADIKDLAEPLYVTMDEAKATATDYGKLMNLYFNEQTGERVQMCWVRANNVLPVDDVQDGEELFVVDGTLQCGDETYESWGWLRFPAVSATATSGGPRIQIKAGSKGAQVFRKTGHLTERALGMEHVQIADDE
jgi:hypothetical protein